MMMFLSGLFSIVTSMLVMSLFKVIHIPEWGFIVGVLVSILLLSVIVSIECKRHSKQKKLERDIRILRNSLKETNNRLSEIDEKII